MSEPFLTDEQIAEWTSTHDMMITRWGQSVEESVIPTTQVIAKLRHIRDAAQAHIDRMAAALDARSAWPQPTDAAAEELARAVTAAHQFDRKMWGYPVRTWESYSPESQAEFIAQAAAVLRRMAGE